MTGPAEGPAAGADQRLERDEADEAQAGPGPLLRAFYGSFLHRWKLSGRAPIKLMTTVADPFSGTERAGRSILRGRIEWGSSAVSTRAPDFELGDVPDRFRVHVHGFAWLRDLASVVDRERGAPLVQPLVGAWLDANADYRAESWRADLIGMRLIFWSLYAPYVLSSADAQYRSAVLGHFARSAKHLDRAHDKGPEGLARVKAAAGLVAAGLMLPGGDARLARGELALGRALDGFALPDGGVVSRCPSEIAETIEWLHVVRSIYLARRRDIPEVQSAWMHRLYAGLKGAMLGDGRITAVNGGHILTRAHLQHLLSLSDGSARAARSGPHSGFQRLTGGATVLVADAGPPPTRRIRPGAHAGALAFELSDGEHRFIVNVGGDVGAPEPLPAELAEIVRMSAAHSVLVLADSNSTEVQPGGGLGRGVSAVHATRHESEEGSWLDAVHDGYEGRFGYLYRRRLFLSGDGRDLRGEDALEPARGNRLSMGRKRDYGFDIRFHLAPGVEATPTADGRGALVKLPGGAVWQLKARGGTVATDESLWIDEDMRARPVAQLVISGTTDAEGVSVKWSFKKVGK